MGEESSRSDDTICRFGLGACIVKWIKAGIIFLLTLVAVANFAPHDPGNPQQVTRFGLALALSEGRVDIDRFADLTVDIASYDGHLYADKPPGLSMLAVPAILATKAALGMPGNAWPLTQQQFYLLMKAAAVSTVGALAALAAAMIYLLTLRLGASEGGALLASCALGLGTLFLPWATAYFAHVATGSILLMAVTLIILARDKGRHWVAPVVGLILGFGLTIDLMAAPAVGLIALFYVVDCREEWPSRLIAGIVGGLVGVAPLLLYNWLAFDSPFRLGYSQVVGFEGMKQGLFGLTAPSPSVAWEILFGLHRGLLPLSPILVLVPIGWGIMWRQRVLRALVVVSLGVAACFVLLNASYFYWDGGSSTGPRHLIAMLPVLSIALAFAWPKSRLRRGGVLALLALSTFVAAAVTVVEVYSDVRYPVPLLDPILAGLFTPEGLAGMARMLVPWLGFVVLAMLKGRPSRTQSDQLPARPLDATLEVKLEQ